jgi:hypothetical protein
MKKENIIIRLIGLFLLFIGGYWFWKSDFAFIPIWGIPLPLQAIVMAVGVFTLISPGPFLNIVALFLPSEASKRLTGFVNNQLTTKETKQVVFQPHDEGEVLSEKLNKAVKDSKRRFYFGVVVALILIPLLILYFIKINNNEQAKLVRDSDTLVKSVQNNRIDYSSIDEFNRILNATQSIKTLSPKESSTRRIYDILSQIYNPEKITSKSSFDDEVSKVYKKEIIDVFNNGPFDIKKIDAPISKSDPPDAKQTLYILLAIICNNEGDNGTLAPPNLYGRGILNELFRSAQGLPNIAYNIDGINYSSLLKSKQDASVDSNTELIKSIFPDNKLPSSIYLATTALSRFDKYYENDKSNIAITRHHNNVVDVYLTSIYLVRIKGDNFDANYQGDKKFLDDIRASDLSKKFRELEGLLDEAAKKNLYLIPIIDTTKAQLYSLEGKVVEKEQGTNRPPEWYKEQRSKAIDAIKEAINTGQPKATFTKDKAKNFYFDWLWDNPETKPILESLTK